MYKKVSTDMSFVAREKEILKFWQENKIFQKSIDSREGGKTFTFYDGPPTANGKPHIGHILTRVIKDIIPRYKTMKGYHVLRKAGWDTHGLPVELEVEKMLGINGKEEIEAYGVEPFIQQCKESVWKYKQEWEQMSDRVGFWADMEDPYITYENEYMESEWWALKKIWEKGLLYKGHKIVPYCPRCGTALSSHEVAQGYQDIKENSIYVRFKVAEERDTYFAVWTTTPWTLPSNVALCVNPEEDYVLAAVDTDIDGNSKEVRYYLAANLAKQILGEDIRILDKMPGKELVGKVYEPLLPYANSTVETSGKKAFFVTADKYVTLSDGTGIVHIAPAFGEDDARLGRLNDLPFVQLVREDGTMPSEVTDFAGFFCKDADKGITEKLKEDGLLLFAAPYEHSYPFCWRCDTALIYYARNSWFIEMTALKDKLLKNNATVNWYPPTIGSGRFGNFLENVVDWGISRERYWGTPLPIWECSCGHRHAVGSIAELKEMSDDCPEDIELHKPYIDAVHIRCPKCSEQMTRVSEVIDCWFDSGAMPFAQWHYPFENQEVFQENFPADFISEALDQTRGWFYTLMAIGTLIFDRSPFKNVIVMGHVQDKDGQKMSKHKGNVVDPWEVLEKQGADAVRWYFYTNSSPWLPSRFYADAVSEAQRKFMGTFWNTYAFYVLYANIDKFNPTQYEFKTENLCVMDRWILSRLNSLVKTVDQQLENYDITTSARAIQQFTDDLSNWYVRRGRERFWQSGMPQDKIDAYLTLYTVLETLTRLSAVYIPFMADEVYRNLILSYAPDSPESVHLCDFPEFDASLIDEQLEKNMDEVLALVVLGRAARNTSAIKNRQPLSGMLVVSTHQLPEEYQVLVKDELNVKEIKYTDSQVELFDYKFKPNLKLLGKKLGKLIPAVSVALADLPGLASYQELQKNNKITITVQDQEIELSTEELLVETLPAAGFATEQNKEITVALDTKLTPELIEQGLVREIISKVQTMRKDSGFDVMDKIELLFDHQESLAPIIEKNKIFIAEEVLAEKIELVKQLEKGKKWDINGHELFINVRKI